MRIYGCEVRMTEKKYFSCLHNKLLPQMKTVPFWLGHDANHTSITAINSFKTNPGVCVSVCLCV